MKISCTISFINEDFCDPITQNDDCINKINIILMDKNILLEGTKVLNINGSNEEKISGIIQNMARPLEALKASSLFNLMFLNFK